MYFLYAILALFAVLLSVILIRTARFTPKAPIPPAEGEVSFDREAAISALQALVRCKTVSRYTHEEEDDGEFKKLVSLLPSLYPAVFEKCTLTRLPDRALLFHLKGRTQGSPSVFMAHYDVVPALEESWEKPAFEGIIENGVMWGRGTLDTKATFNGVLFAANTLLTEGFVPENDLYFAFSGGEEVNGPGARHIVNYFKENNIPVSLVVDEGGAVVENVFPGVKAPCGLIGIAEKGMMDLEYRIASGGGHASSPPPRTSIGRLSAACCAIERNPFPSHLTKPVAEMFDTLGRHSSFLFRMIFANLWCFAPLLDLICKKSGGELNALMRTTVAFTQMKGSNACNVLPPEASMVSNIRLNPEDTMESAKAYLEKVVANERIELSPIQGMNPSRISRTDCEEYRRVAAAIAGTWPGTLVSPYLMVQCSDSRHYGAISDRVYRFSAMDLTSEERRTIHGHNERIRLECVGRAVEFYIRLMKQC